ncbi:MAG: nuclear transport factor 2 family protein [Rhodospirillales bacterium]|nr:nuclear transport factor 2 family protein [Rhodospirillales bacterium]
MSNDSADIAKALVPYFDGFFEGDVEKLKRIFHPSCHLYCATHDPMTDFDMETVYGRVAGRTKPSERGDPREDGIITIDQSGPECAFAKIYISLGNQRFTDYLTLLKIDNRWQIITKTFTYVARPEVAAL